jgi:hypothetical protein
MDPFTPYLAGFFDGDGSVHFQIVRSIVYRFGFYIRSSLVFTSRRRQGPVCWTYSRGLVDVYEEGEPCPT